MCLVCANVQMLGQQQCLLAARQGGSWELRVGTAQQTSMGWSGEGAKRRERTDSARSSMHRPSAGVFVLHSLHRLFAPEGEERKGVPGEGRREGAAAEALVAASGGGGGGAGGGGVLLPGEPAVRTGSVLALEEAGGDGLPTADHVLRRRAHALLQS